MTSFEIDVLDEMERTGGGFVSHLAQAWRRADAENFQRLMAAFPEIWREYARCYMERTKEMDGRYNAHCRRSTP